jgi:hypothetical protein
MSYPKKFYISYKHEKSMRVEMVEAFSHVEAWLKVISKLNPEETLRNIEVEEKRYA